MKWKVLLVAGALMMLCGCAGDHYAGKFEAHMTVDPSTGHITGLDVVTTKNYGNINAKGTIDPKTNLPMFEISAENVDATSLAAIVAKSNADIAKSVSKVAGAAGAVVAPIVGGE